MNRKVTIKDIANKVGVSKTTISRYLNNNYISMSNDTKIKIKKVIEELNYMPSTAARSLKNKRTKLIGVVVSDIENPFSAGTIKSISNSLTNTEYSLLIADSKNDLDEEKRHINLMQQQNVEAIFINAVDYNNSNYLLKVNTKIPVILLDRNIKEDQLDLFYSDNSKSMKELLYYLNDKGYKKIFLFTEDCTKISTRQERIKNFKTLLKEMNYSNLDNYVKIIDKDNELNTKKIIIDILNNNKNIPICFFCINGPTLVHTSVVLKKLKLNIPNEVGICGYDDFGSFTKFGWSILPSKDLTTLAPNWSDLGSEAVKRAFERIKNKSSICDPIKKAIDVVINYRESTNINKNKNN